MLSVGKAVIPLVGSLPEKAPSVEPLEPAPETVQTARPISLENPIINERAAYTTAKVNVRSAPSKNGPILRQLSNQTLVSVVEINGDWARVRDGDTGKDFGWVYKTFLKSP
jgi:SH3-like domain-containing protein